ncbi:hypothetical protein [Rathayibacter sp. AY1E2]|uniref:hypothetical protein n=1 Tax=Rathayibacter sp. AY1E2 TaxID=2080550 RepID=UPI0011B04AB4|nr:hypothetical protein [Rathayibacter sp. AY1E2]
MARRATTAVHDSGSSEGRSWLAHLFGRPAAETQPVVPARVPRAPQTREQIVAQYTSMVQGFVDDDPTQPPSAVFVCGVGPMTVNVDGDSRVALTPRTSMN